MLLLMLRPYFLLGNLVPFDEGFFLNKAFDLGFIFLILQLKQSHQIKLQI